MAGQAQPNDDTTKAAVLLQAAELMHLSAAIRDMREDIRSVNMRIEGLRADIATRWPTCEAHRQRLDDVERRMGEAERHVENLNTLQKGWASVNTALALIAGVLGVKQ